MIDDDLQRIVRSEMLEQSEENRVAMSRIDIRNLDDTFIAARFGHDRLWGKRFALCGGSARGLLRLPFELKKQCINMADQPLGMVRLKNPAQNGLEVGLHDPTGDAAIGTHQIDDVLVEGRKAAARRRQIKNGVERSLHLRPVGTRNVGQDVTEVRMEPKGNERSERQFTDEG